MLKRNALVNKIIGEYMHEQGFVLKTDKKTYWEWYYNLYGDAGKVTIYDEDGYIQLYFGNGVGNMGYIRDKELMYTINNPRTKIEEWNYYNFKGDLKELYVNILEDMLDIIKVSWRDVLERLSKEYNKHVPNRKHFVMYRDNYDQLALEYLQKYDLEDKTADITFRTVINQIRLLSEKELEEVESILVGLAAMLEESVIKQFGGNKEIYEQNNAVIVTEIGRYKQIYNFLLMTFHIWKNPMYVEEYERDFLEWYNREIA